MKQLCDERAEIISEKDELIRQLTLVLIRIILYAYLFIHTATYAPFDNL